MAAPPVIPPNMTLIKVKLSFIRMPVPPKVDFGKNTVTKMMGNPVFTSPDVPLSTIQTASQNLEDKYNAAQVGGPQQTADMDAAELALNDLLRKQAAYVQRIANGDEVKIFSAGFLPTKAQADPIALPVKVEKLKLKADEQAGTIHKINDKTPNAKMYATVLMTNQNMPITVDGNLLVITIGADKIIIDISTFRKRRYVGLESGKRIYVKTAAINSAGKGPDSDVINIIVP